MCFHYKQSADAQKLKNRFKIKQLPLVQLNTPALNGFNHPLAPIISNSNKESIQLFRWGLIPSWANNIEIRKNTLNAKIETLHEKPSFKENINKRCLILADEFTEWQWQDNKGKNKKKFDITLPSKEPFAFAGLWSEWLDKNTGELINSYTIVTTEAKGLMAEIHNSKKRMPVILTPQNETDWLEGAKTNDFALCKVDLIATEDKTNNPQLDLF